HPLPPSLPPRRSSDLFALDRTHEHSDIIVDYDVIDTTPPDYDWLWSRVPLLSRWRRFIVTGGSFPPDLKWSSCRNSGAAQIRLRSEEHTSELQSRSDL